MASNSQDVVAPLPSSPPPELPPIPNEDEPPIKKRKLANITDTDNTVNSEDDISDNQNVDESEVENRLTSDTDVNLVINTEDDDDAMTESEDKSGICQQEFDVIDDLGDVSDAETGECTSSDDDYIDDDEVEAMLEAGIDECIKRQKLEAKEKGEADPIEETTKIVLEGSIK